MKRKWISLLLCMALVAGLTACGSQGAGSADQNQAGDSQGAGSADQNQAGDSQGADGAEENGGTDEADGQASNGADDSSAKDEITFVLDWTPNTNHTGIYVAQAKGYFEEAGLNVNIIQPPEDGATMLVAGGGAQFGVDFQDTLTPAFATDHPLPVTAVAGIIQHNTSGLISLKENGIDTPKKMEEFTYATWDLEIEQAIVKYAMEKDGGDFAKLNMIPSTVNDVVSALQTDVDLVWIYYAWDGVATKLKGLETNYINFADLDPALDYYSPVIIANNDYLEENPKQAKAFLQAVKKGYEFAIEHPEEAAQMLCESAPELDPEIVLESQKWLAGQYQADAESWGVIDGTRWEGFYNWLYDNGVIDQKIPDGLGYSNEYLE